MAFNDFMYYITLFICISLGSHYKQIDDIDMKRNFGAGLGLLVTCLICGPYMVYSLIVVIGNVVILKCCDRHYVHQISLCYTWTLLQFLHYNFSSRTYMMSIFQTIALRLVGLSCELNVTDKPRSTSVSKVSAAATYDTDIAEVPEAIDILSYAYYFIGLHKGPYYRWRIFADHLDTPFGALGDCRIITEEKLKKAFVFGLGYYILQMRFSTEMYEDQKFYTAYGTDFRYLFNVPLLIMYYLHTATIVALSTGICTESGFGVYPTKCAALPGCGPSAHPSVLNMIATAPDTALEQEYNFGMLNSFDTEKLLIGPKIKDTLRGWDMSTRYWYWAFANRKFVKANKEVRSAFSFMIWTLWCGPSIPQLIISMTLWLAIHLESEYSALYDTEGSMKLPWDIGFSIMRMFCLLYLTPCFVVEDTSTVLRYYNSIYWMFHIVLFVLMVVAVIVFKVRGDN